MATIEEIASLCTSIIVLDANFGCWQVPLDK